MSHSPLTPRQAADLLGVSESTVRRWCDRDLLPTTRTAGKHRRIERAALLQFARREGIAVASKSLMTAGRGGRLAAPEDLSDRLFQELVVGDELVVRGLIVDLAAESMEPSTVCDEVIAPAMHRIGDAWEIGQVGVYQEHAATQAILAGISDARLHIPSPEATARVAVCASLTGDPYSLGPAMSALILQAEGYRPRLVGADTPIEELPRAVRDTAAAIVALSVGAVPDAAKLVEDLHLLTTSAAGQDVLIAVGGHGLNRELRSQMTADFFGDTMGHLASFARRQRKELNKPGA
ncbi:MAG: helix-turn-helix domain-containing protein [Proteobacteria bacterium]|nr:helix-turn-helix domain-containing protein [Pseudomonadota bacterium]